MMRFVFPALRPNVRCRYASAVLFGILQLFTPWEVAVAQQPRATAPDSTPQGGKPVVPNRPAGVRGGFDNPAPGELVRPVPDAAKPADTGGPSAHRGRSGVSTYPLGTGDVVRVTVFQQPDMTTETRVTESGTLTFPLLGPIDVAGLNTKELEARIANLLKTRGFVKEPQVTATIMQFKSRQISIIGHVNRP